MPACAEPENVMVRHAHTPQGLAYRDGSGLACVLADFGSAKMLPPLNVAATELDPHVDNVFAATRRFGHSWLSRGFWQLQPVSTHQTLGPRQPAIYTKAFPVRLFDI